MWDRHSLSICGIDILGHCNFTKYVFMRCKISRTKQTSRMLFLVHCNGFTCCIARTKDNLRQEKNHWTSKFAYTFFDRQQTFRLKLPFIRNYTFFVPLLYLNLSHIQKLFMVSGSLAVVLSSHRVMLQFQQSFKVDVKLVCYFISRYIYILDS